jgi:hypothetical protein
VGRSLSKWRRPFDCHHVRSEERLHDRRIGLHLIGCTSGKHRTLIQRHEAITSGPQQIHVVVDHYERHAIGVNGA